MDDDTIELKPSLGKKLAYILFSGTLSIIAGNIVLVPFVFIGTTQRFFHLSDMVAGLIVFIGISLDLFVVVICFKKFYRYFIKECSA